MPLGLVLHTIICPVNDTEHKAMYSIHSVVLFPYWSRPYPHWPLPISSPGRLQHVQLKWSSCMHGIKSQMILFRNIFTLNTLFSHIPKTWCLHFLWDSTMGIITDHKAVLLVLPDSSICLTGKTRKRQIDDCSTASVLPSSDYTLYSRTDRESVPAAVLSSRRPEAMSST